MNDLEHRFQSAKITEQQLKIYNPIVKEKLAYLRITASSKSFFGCGCNSFGVDPSFQRAFETLSREEKMEFYCRTV